jgi:uncharacterized membrane protein YeaQ/YmgE (transglycosylase-associated protein family)
MNVLTWAVVGLVAGFLAGQVMRGGGYGVIGDIIIGILGGLLGGWIGSTFLNINTGVSGINLESILIAFAGAVLLILVLRMIGRRRSVIDDDRR